MNHNSLLISLVVQAFLSIIPFIAFSQATSLTFDETDLDIVVRSLESNSDYIFNYDPLLLKEYQYSGTISDPIKIADLQLILHNSPLDYIQDGNTILIYASDPKEYNICGTILDGQSNETLQYGNVFATDANVGVQSGKDGYFELKITAIKNQEVTISYIGYETLHLMVQDLALGDCPDYKLQLDDKLWNQEIIITDYILDGITEGETYSGYDLDYGQLSKFHSDVEHDIFKTAQLMPGITSIDESASNIQIRGSAPDQNMIMWEGATVYHSGHIFGMISAINPFSVNSVNIYKGAHDPKYDNRVGGIVDISGANTLTQDMQGSIGTTLTEAHVNMEVPVVTDKMSIILSGRSSINGLYNSPPLLGYVDKVFQGSIIDDPEPDSQSSLLSPDRVLRFNDWSAKILYQAHENLVFSAGRYSNYNEFTFNLSFPGDPFLAVDNTEVQAGAMHVNMGWAISPKWTGSYSFLQSTYDNSYIHTEEENGVFQADYERLNDIFDQTLSFSHSYQASTQLELSAGYDYNTKRVNYSILGNFFNEPFDDFGNANEAHFHNLFASLNYRTKAFQLNAGMRTTYHIEPNKWFYAPRFSAQYGLYTNFKLKLEGGIFHQFINQLNEFGNNNLSLDNLLWVLNNDEIELPQQAHKLALGFIYHNDGWLIDVEVYYNYTTGLTSESTLFSRLVTQGFSIGESKAIGIDLLLKKRFNSFNIWMNYSLGRINYLFPNLATSNFPAPNDIRHIISLVSSYQVKKFNFSITGRYNSGLPFSQPTSILEFYDEPSGLTSYDLEYNALNNARLKPYFRIDMGINYRTSLFKASGIQSEFSFSFINLLNRENIFTREHYIDPDNSTNNPEVLLFDKVLLGRTPLVMVRLYW